ncbi:MAG TPA: HYR domain-containing protein [Actinomycetota bacterium]|nr:HYR domain-containing protein [Actinomycetota bacterium]
MLDLPSDMTVVIRGVGSQQASRTLSMLQAGGTTVTYSATAVDAVTGAAAVTCDPASGSSFPIGSTTVTCAGTDLSGNVATGSFLVTVVQVGSGGAGELPPTDGDPDEVDSDDDEVLGEQIHRGSSAGSPTGSTPAVLGSTIVRSGLLPFTGAGSLATFFLIGLLLIAAGLWIGFAFRRRATNPLG